MQWFNGSAQELLDQWSFTQNPLWADYQVLGPNFGALSVLMGVEDVLPIMIGSRGCVTHLRFTKIAWGIDYNLNARPYPFIEIQRSDVIQGRYHVGDSQMQALKKLLCSHPASMLVVMSNDDVLLTCADLSALKAQLEKELNLPVAILEISAISSANQWAGYDHGLETLFAPFWNEAVPPKEGVNLVGWKWPSRERFHDIGSCLALLQSLGVRVNHVIPGGCRLADIRDSLGSQANVLWCPSYIGQTLERLEQERGIRIAGYTPPYGYQGTLDWLAEVESALGSVSHLREKALPQLEEARQHLAPVRARLEGKRAFISGGPGRLPGLLSVMVDLGVEVVAAGLYWPHSSSKPTLNKIMHRLPHLPEKVLVAPSLYEIEEIAQTLKPDFWMGGFQEQHTCKRHRIPFIPTTVYTASHQCFEGVRNVGRKIEMALDGYDFVATAFRSTEEL
jgi:nitrogenase molybdenum-iron protein alpha/beta subunit